MSAVRNKRRGLHKLECECGAGVYATWAQLERHGCPVCSCGERFTPDDLDLAAALGLEDAPVIAEYRAKLSSVMHGQARVGRGTGVDYCAERTAADAIDQRRRERALAARLNALRPAPEALPF